MAPKLIMGGGISQFFDGSKLGNLSNLSSFVANTVDSALTDQNQEIYQICHHSLPILSDQGSSSEV